jgi:formate C-acetyltransferase
MNKRIARLREKLFEQDPKVCAERCVIFTESMKKTEGEPIALRRAKAFASVLEKMSIFVNDDELIVGNIAKWPKASPIFPEYSVDWVREELMGKPYKLEERPGDRFYCDDDVKDEIFECLKYWDGKSLLENFISVLPKDVDEAWKANVIDDTWCASQGLGQIVPDYGEFVRLGLQDVIKRTKEAIVKLDKNDSDYIRRSSFLEGIIIENNALVAYAARYADECQRIADLSSTTAQRKIELLKLVEISRYVPMHPARNFYEAVQSVFFLNVAMHLESNGHSFSFGRFDQYLYPLFKKDVEEGSITREEGLEIIEAFFIKCNEFNKLRKWDDTEFFLGYQMFINLAVAGQTADGEDAINTISELCVEACANVKLATPSISVKCFEKTSDEFILKSINAMEEHKGGQPAFYSDKAFMRALDNMGIAKEDQFNWVPTGCIEASIPGKWDFAAKGPWLNVEKILDIVLNNGNDPKTGYHFIDLPKDISEFTSTEEIFECYKSAVLYFIDLQVKTEKINDEIHVKCDINPFRSSLVHDCIGRGLDLVEGGSIYSADGGPTAGTISTGDAFSSLDYLVFTKKLLTMEQVLHALSTNYEDNTTTPTGNEIRAMFLNKAPKFGNDDERADKWTVAIEDYIGRTYRYHCKSSKYGKGPIPCCYSYSQSPVSGNVAFGKSIGATPDGRKKGDPVNNGVSPENGSEKNGITAACNSILKIPTQWISKGAIFNVRLAKSVLSTEENKKKLVGVIKVFLDNYGEQIQFNVVDNKVFKAAMLEPEKYKDLMVRVSGYSALFTSLSYDCQMDILNRSEMAL